MSPPNASSTAARDAPGPAGPSGREPVEAFLHRSIPELFAEQVAARPHAIALVAGERTLSYRELDARANRLARRLVAFGVGPDTLVAILAERSVESIVGLLGILKAGGAYVPLDPQHPAERHAAILRDTAAPVLLVQSHLRAQAPAHAGSQLELDAYAREPLAATPETAPPVQVTPAHLAYCTYSSGSTGRPKGILTTQAGVVRLVKGANYARLDADQVILHAAPLAFDASTFEIWGALLNGGRLVLACNGLVPLEDTAAAVRRHGVTTLWLTAALFHRWCEGPLRELSGLRQLLAGGDVLRPEAVRTALRALPDCRLVNGYGPTEATTFAACHDIPRDFTGASVPLGRPIQATTIRVLDARLAPVAEGEPGEICIAGPGLARGYLNDPEGTAARFVADPFGAPGSLLYRSGDRGRWLADGTLEFLGRIDRQLKISGVRVEPGEVEAVLATHPGIAECAVLATDDGPAAERRLAAYIVASGADTPALESLQAHLRRHLPEQMVPSLWCFLPALPLQASGKLDPARLPRATASRELLAAPWIAPRTPLEQRIAAAWCEVLGLERAGLADRFRALGGSSIQAIAVAHRLGLGAPAGTRTPPPLGNVTLGDYAERLQQAQAEATGAAAAPAEPFDAECASYAQQQLWFLEQQSDDAWRAYRFQARLDFTGSLDVEALRAALDALVQRHAILRTRFVAKGGELARIVAARGGAALRLDDVAGLPPAARDAAFAKALAEEREHRFDPAAAPPVRWRLVTLAPEHHVLLQTEHHHLHDGQTFRILLRDLAALYRARLAGGPAALPRIEAEYAAYCAEQRRWLRTADFARQRDAWVARLDDFRDDQRLFRDGAASAPQAAEGGQLRVPLSAQRLARIDAAAGRLGVSRFAWMMAAYGVLCARLARRRRVLVGSALAGRPDGRWRWTAGMFVNMVPVPIRTDGAQPFDAFARRVADEVDFALAHGEVPLGEIVRGLGLAAHLRGETPFNVGFSFHDSLPVEADFPGLGVRLEEALPNGAPKFGLDVVVIAGNPADAGGAAMMWEFDCGLFDRASVDAIAAGYLALLDATVDDPARPLGTLPLVSAEERERLLERGRPSAAARVDGPLAHESIAAHARRAPTAIAARCAGRSLTYAELDARADALAHRLLAAGVRAEAPVAVFVERGFDALVALLAALKSGGVYLPLDTQSPRGRLALVLADARPVAVVTDAALADRLPAGAAAVVRIDDDNDGRPGAAPSPSPSPVAAAPAPAVAAEDAAYCLYTSGSTGRPKGVLVTAGALARHLHGCVEAYGLTPADIALQFASTSVDASIEQMLAPLCAGATLLLRDAATWSLDELARAIDGDGVTVADIPTAYWHALAADGHAALRAPSLRLVILGGEAALRALRPEPPLHARVLNAYGPTEATITACLGEIRADDAPPRGPYEPIGRPVAGVHAFIVDEGLSPVPPGVAGELCIAGPQLARGYLGPPDPAAEKFIANPFGRGGDRLYRTGDRARWLADGRIEFLGRTDAQLKVRGFRIEAGDVESALLACAGVSEAVVVARDGEAGDRQLVAHIVAAPGTPPRFPALELSLGERLPPPMVPTAWRLHASLPRTPGGKIDRRALGELAGGPAATPTTTADGTTPALQGAADDAAARSPDTTLSAVIALACELMPGTAVRPDDDLIRLGMHSVLILRFVAQGKQRFGVALKVREVYRLATPAAIAMRIEAAAASGS